MESAQPQPHGPQHSRLQLPPGVWETLLDGLCARFPAIPREAWVDRFARGRVLDATGDALALDAPYRLGAEVRYFREVADEPVIPFAESVLHADADLAVVTDVCLCEYTSHGHCGVIVDGDVDNDRSLELIAAAAAWALWELQRRWQKRDPLVPAPSPLTPAS